MISFLTTPVSILDFIRTIWTLAMKLFTIGASLTHRLILLGGHSYHSMRNKRRWTVTHVRSIVICVEECQRLTIAIKNILAEVEKSLEYSLSYTALSITYKLSHNVDSHNVQYSIQTLETEDSIISFKMIMIKAQASITLC